MVVFLLNIYGKSRVCLLFLVFRHLSTYCVNVRHRLQVFICIVVPLLKNH